MEGVHVMRGFITVCLAVLVAATGIAHAEDPHDVRAAKAVKNAGNGLTAAQREALLERGAEGARERADNPPETAFHHGGGTRGAGAVLVNGVWKDVNTLAPGADLQRTNEASSVSGNAHSLDAMEAGTEAAKERQAKDPSMGGRAGRAVDEAGTNHARIRSERDTFNLAPIAEQLSREDPVSDVFAGCDDEDVIGTRERRITMWDDFRTCQRIVYPNDSEIACERWYVRVPNIINLDQDRREFLNVGSETEGDICRVSRNLSLSQVITPFEFRVTLQMGDEETTKLCTRRRHARIEVTEEERSVTDTLGINQEVGGQSYWSERRIRELSGELPQSTIRTLQADTQREGLLCTREHSPSAGTATASESRVAAVNVNTETNNTLRCTVRRTASQSQQSVNGSTTARVGVDGRRGNELLAERWIEASQSTATQSASVEVTASVNNETNQQLCVNQVWPENTTTSVPKSKDVMLGVDTQSGGTLCQAYLSASTGSGQTATSEQRVLAIGGSSSGTQCTRRRKWGPSWNSAYDPSIGAPTVCGYVFAPGGSVDAFAYNGGTGKYTSGENPFVVSAPICWEVTPLEWPWHTNNYTIPVSIRRYSTAECNDIGGSQSDNPTGATVCLAAVGAHYTQPIWDEDQGSCAPAGGQCTSSWSCDRSAPSGWWVYEAGSSPYDNIVDTWSLDNVNGPLYPGGSSRCLQARLSTTCAEPTQASRWRLSVPAGTTSINSLHAYESPDNAGTEISVTEWPSAANDYWITVVVTRTAFHYTPANPNVVVTYNAVRPFTQVTRQYSPNAAACDQDGTTNCPAEWTCNSSAPGYVSGVYVDAATAATGNPLHWSAPFSTCLSATKFKSCSGSADYPTTHSLSPQVGNVPSISNYNIQWLNPDARLSVSPLGGVSPPTPPAWNQSFTVRRNDMSSQPPNPSVRMSWTESVPSQTVSVRTVWGNCNGTGTPTCPAQWICNGYTGMQSNGITVTQGHVDQVRHLLYSTAPGGTPPANCALAIKNTQCGGTSTATSVLDVSAAVAGQVNPRNFVLSAELGGQPGISGAITVAPSAANGWRGQITVSRTNYTYTPTTPRFRVTWTHDVTTTSSAVRESGNVNATGDAVCPVVWSCSQAAPFTPAGGVTVTAAMAQARHPLFPGSSNSSCQRGSLNRVCSGSVATSTVVTLTGVPANASSVSITSSSISPQQTGVALTYGQPRREGQNWVVDVTLTRSTWSANPPQQPDVTLNWTSSATVTNFAELESPPGCRNAQGTTFCPVRWSCALEAPAVGSITIDGVQVNAGMVNGLPSLYTGAPAACVVGELRNSCAGEPTMLTTIPLGLPAGTTSVTDLRVDPTGLPANVVAEIVPPLPTAPGWTVTVRTRRTSWADIPTVPAPSVTIRWNRGYGVVNWEQLTSNPCDTTTGPSANCAPNWRCAQAVPAGGLTINGVNVTQGMISAQPRLWTGGDPYCVRAERRMECANRASTPSQELCIRDLLPANATSVGNPDHRWLNPIAGVFVIRESVPTAANNFCYRFRVEKENYSVDLTAPANIPQVELTWDTYTTDVEYSVVSAGNAADAGSPSCPTQWSCPVLAPQPPASIDWPGPSPSDPHLPIDASDVSGLTPRLWTSASVNATGDAPAACLRAELNRVCSAELISEDTITLPVTEGVDGIEVLGWTANNMADLEDAGVRSIVVVGNPTNANGWQMRFQVLRGDNGVPPPAPSITVTWRERTSRIVFDEPPPEEGNCALPGTEACPLDWRCTITAPHTWPNGTTVTPELVQSMPALFPGADPVCVEGELWRNCTGADAGVLTEVYVGDQIDQANVAEIEGFRFTWTNPDPRLSIELVSPPTAPNWTAVFRVVRDYGVPAPGGKQAKEEGDPATPELTLNWAVRGPAVWQHEIIVAPNEDGSPGSCDDEGTPNCPATWVCDRPLPTELDAETLIQTIGVDNDGNPVVIDETTTLTQLRNLAPLDFESTGAAELFFGEEFGCWEARKVMVCQGSDPQLTTISIADQIPPSVRELSNFRVEVVYPGVGVAMNFDCTPGAEDCDLIQVPTWSEDPAQRWVAVLRTRRTDWSVEPVKPEVVLRWELAIERVEIEIQETGNCGVESNDFCNVSWVCTGYAEGLGPPSGEEGEGSPEQPPGRSLGELIETSATVFTARAGEIDSIHTVSIANRVGEGHDTVSGFHVDVSDGDARVYVVSEPTAANGWLATVSVEKTDIDDDSRQRIVLRLRWYNIDALPPPEEDDPIDGSELIGIPPLYRQPTDPEHWPDAPEGCVRAVRRWDCSPITDGHICNESGRICDDVTDGDFDECAAMEREGAFAGCRLENDECVEGSSDGGHCYINARRYACPRDVITQDRIVSRQSGCGDGVVGCLDGDCDVHTREEDQFDQASTNRSWAMRAYAQNAMTDWTNTDTDGQPEPPPPPPGCEDCNFTEKSGKPGKSWEDGEYDPWEEPEGYTPPRLTPFTPGTPPPGFDPSDIKFFHGREYNCMRLFGCCTKPVAPQENKEEFWTAFGEQLRQNAAQLQACAPNEEGAHADLTAGATQGTLNRSFTSMFETAMGGGEALSCGGTERMEPVMAQTVRNAMNEIKPNLSGGWLCDDDEFELATQKETGSCAYVGRYCQTRVLGICIDRRDRYCCFNSPMTRMLREQLADQNPNLFGFGTPSHPKCDGIDIQAVGQVGLSEENMSELEGLMVEGGAMDIFGQLGIQGLDVEALMSGDLSSIGRLQEEPNRQNVSDRTAGYTQATDHVAARASIEGNTLTALPTTVDIDPEQEVQVTLASSARVVRVGERLELVVRRLGALGQTLNVRLDVLEGTARANVHYAAQGSTMLVWGPNDRSDKIVTLQTLRPVPPATDRRTLVARLTNAYGPARLYPNPETAITIAPNPP